MQEGENPFGPQPNLDAAPAAEPAAPVVDQATTPQPVVGAPVIDNATPVVGGTQVAVAKGAGMSKGLLFGIIGGVVGIVLIVLGVIFIPALFKPDYEDAKAKVEAVDDALDVILYDECSDVAYGYDDEDTSDENFNEALTECEAGFTKMEENVKALESSTGVKNDEEIKELFSKFKTEYDALIPKLKDQLVVYKDIRGFASKWDDIYYAYDDEIDIVDAEVDEMTSSMTNSTNAVLKEYGPKLNTSVKLYIDAYNEYEKAYDQYWDDEITYDEYYEIREAYYDAEDELEGIYEEMMEDLDELMDIDYEDDVEDFSEALSDLKSKIKTKYYESQQ